MFLDYLALFLLCFVAIVLFYGIIVVHDIPYEIAEKRNHPHLDAIHVAGWISMFTLHAIWPFLWIWATLWREDRGWGFNQLQEEQHDIHHKVNLLSDEIREIKSEIRALNAIPVLSDEISGEMTGEDEAQGDDEAGSEVC